MRSCVFYPNTLISNYPNFPSPNTWSANYPANGVSLAQEIDLRDPDSWIARRSTVLLSPDNDYPYDNQGHMTFNTVLSIVNSRISGFDFPGAPPYPWFVAPEDIAKFFTERSLIKGDIDETQVANFYSWATEDRDPNLQELVDIKAGDYVYVNSNRGDGDSDNHGFLIVGWGPIQDCASAIASSLSFGSDIQANHFTDSIPYVVDYSGTVPNNLQTPTPRPFYCSAYNDPNTSQEDFFSSDHVWFFFTMPDVITVTPDRLYGNP